MEEKRTKVYLDTASSSSANMKLLCKFGAIATSNLLEANVFVSGMAFTNMCAKARSKKIPIVKEDWIIDSAISQKEEPIQDYLSKMLENVSFAYANLENTEKFERLVKQEGGTLVQSDKAKFDVLVYNPLRQPSELAARALFQYQVPMIPEVDFYQMMRDAVHYGKPLQFVPDYHIERE